MALTHLWAVASLPVMLLLAGCGDSPPNGHDGGAPASFIATVDAMLEDAESDGVSDSQVSLLESARLTGQVTLEMLQDAESQTFACFDRAGIRHDELAPEMRGDMLTPQYAYEGGDKTAVAEECIREHSYYVETLYAIQPAAVEANDARFASAMPKIIACLRDMGYEVDDDVTPAELKDMIAMQADEIGTPAEADARARLTCATDAGGLTDGY